MNLGEFHTLVKEVVKRGDTLDHLIPLIVKEAAFWLEQNYTLKYMERFGKYHITELGEYPYYLDVPNQRVKDYIFVRYEEADCYKYLKQVDLQDVVVKKDVPTCYCTLGKEFIVLNADKEMDIEIPTSVERWWEKETEINERKK